MDRWSKIGPKGLSSLTYQKVSAESRLALAASKLSYRRDWSNALNKQLSDNSQCFTGHETPGHTGWCSSVSVAQCSIISSQIFSFQCENCLSEKENEKEEKQGYLKLMKNVTGIKTNNVSVLFSLKIEPWRKQGNRSKSKAQLKHKWWSHNYKDVLGCTKLP